MNRLLLPLLSVSAVAIAFVGTGLGTPPSGDDPPGSRYEDEPWVLLSVSADGRVLRVQGRGGGCGRDPRAKATETASTVTVKVWQIVPASARLACPAIARIDELRVRLATPIAGRTLIGQSLRDPETGLTGRPRVPRVVGLRAEDAAFALRAQGFRVRGLQRGTVRGQTPSPRTPAEPARTTMTLTSAPFPSAVPPLRPVRFRTVAAGGIESAYDPHTGFTVRSEKRWRALWRRLTAGDDPLREPPPVNFSQEMLLVVTQGRRPAGDDHVRIASVGDTGGTLEVYVNEYTSSARCRGADVHQYPYHVVRIPRSPNRAHFVRFRKPAPCPPSRP